VVSLSADKPRRLSFRDGYEKYLTALTNSKGKPSKRPNIHHVAAWIYRKEDLQAKIGAIPDLKLIANAFINDFQLTDDEIKAIFDLTVPPIAPGLLEPAATAPPPEDYLPEPPTGTIEEDGALDEEDEAPVVQPDIGDDDPI